MKFLLVSLCCAACTGPVDPYASWKVRGGTSEGLQFSSLTNISRENVCSLEVAWRYTRHEADTIGNRSQIQCNPIVVNGKLYGTSASLGVFALDAATGKELWYYKPDSAAASLGANRGVTYWEDGSDRHILYSYGEFLYALNAETGVPISSFGERGRTSLKAGLGERAANLMVLSNSPGVIYKNLIIVGSRVHEGPVAAPGHVRAFDVRTGKLAWVFHTIPQPGEAGKETWPTDAWKTIGGANAWSGMTVDAGRGLVFAATGSASFDFYGGNRKGENLYANCVLALDAATGKRRWHYQIMHHDMWDRDLPAAPVLATIDSAGIKVDVVAQATKTGYIYVFNRTTGTPVFPIVETAVASSTLEGESAWPTQPLPTRPAPFTRQQFTEDMINPFVSDTADLRKKFRSYLSGKSFLPPSKEGTIVFPGFDGGAGWGGSSFNPQTQTLFINANEIPCVLTMVDVRLSDKMWAGISLYRTHCATCHGLDRQGDGKAYPSIYNVKSKYTKASLMAFAKKGKGAMPSFAHLEGKNLDAISRYVLDLEERTPEEKKGFFERQPGILFSNTGYTRFFTQQGYPAIAPPWGTLTAIQLADAKIQWQVPLGEYKELSARGIPPTGTGNYGGPVTTASGLIFIAATRDEKIRAIDQANGKTLWEYPLPAAGYATPALYQQNGRMFLVIACGGGKLGTRSGDSYIAFSLPRK